MERDTIRMIEYWFNIENRWIGKTYSRKHLEKEDLNINDLELYIQVSLE